MGFGIEEPTHMAFNMTFDYQTDAGNIKLVVDQLIDDGWEVSYDKDLRQLFAKNKIVKVAPPTVIQGPPDPVYMAQKAYKGYRGYWDERKADQMPLWSDLHEDARAAWTKAAKAILPK